MRLGWQRERRYPLRVGRDQCAFSAVPFCQQRSGGAVPMSPGCVMPVNCTPGMCREVAVWPLKSQIAL
ncbi:hypothetical protein BTZ20_0758 [Rhodococcus sp. MTM3W5.2]|nr:hypothetical protein BTZ20_0758 [Rhodococcus sp. MTM3W5.2]